MMADSVARDSMQGPAAAGSIDARPARSMSERIGAAKARFKAQGVTIADWADAEGYNRRLVYKVLAGRLNCDFGISHNIAVKLDIKDGEVNPAHEPQPTLALSNA
jgi:gp16 family phage-associated protein